MSVVVNVRMSKFMRTTMKLGVRTYATNPTRCCPGTMPVKN